MSNRLVFLVPAHAGSYVLREGAVTTIGRASDNSIQITADSVSRYHIKMDNTHTVCIVEDVGSTNGTYVNSKPITKYELKHNDEISIGSCQLRFEQIVLEESEDANTGRFDYSDRTKHGTIKIKSFKPAEGRSVPANIKTERAMMPVAPLTLKKKV